MTRGKIITTLRLRREIEEQMRELLELQSEEALSGQIAHIIAHGETTVSTILANLETTDPHFRGALGLVASHLPHAEIAGALRGVARDETEPDQARLTAMMILERFLEEEVDANTMQGLRDPNQVAMQSLLEVTSESRSDRTILIEYVRGLAEQPEELALLVLDALREIPGEDQIELLRVLAQDERASVREHALTMLSQNRSPASRTALQTLLPTTPAELHPTIKRGLQKLTLAGIPDQPLPAPDTSWRALISAIDGRGNQSLWFLQEYPNAEHCRFLSVLVNDREGLLEAFGGDRITGQHFPPPAPESTLHTIPLRDSVFELNLLEADFDLGRRLVLNGLETTFAQQQPTPIEYRLLNDLLWGYSTHTVDAGAHLPEMTPNAMQALLPQTADLFDNADFSTWFLQNELIYEYAEQLRFTGDGDSVAAAPIEWVIDIARVSFEDDQIRELYATRLNGMSEWLLASGQEQASRLAAAAAFAMSNVPAAEHPFLLRLTQHGLSIAIHNVRTGGLSLVEQ